MIDQRTPEWYARRCAKVTANKAADVIARIKSWYFASIASYIADLAFEALTGRPANTALPPHHTVEQIKAELKAAKEAQHEND